MKLTDISGINVRLPSPAAKEIPKNSPQDVSGLPSRRVLWDKGNPGTKQPECETCGHSMVLMNWRNVGRFWSCFSSRCVYESRIPKHSPIDIRPICHKCGADMDYYMEAYSLNMVFACPSCEARIEF